LQKLLQGSGDKKKGTGSSKESNDSSSKDSSESSGGIMDQIAELFSSGTTENPVGSVNEVAGNMSVDPQSFLSDVISGGQGNYGMSVDPGLNLDAGYDPATTDSYNFVPDTTESFKSSYGTAPGYDFTDYDEYFFD